jgi:hypothetical protein
MITESYPFAAQTIKVWGMQEIRAKVRDKIRAPLIDNNK